MTNTQTEQSSLAVQRNRARRIRIKAAGGRQINLLIAPAAAQALDALTAAHGETMTACIERLLAEAVHKEQLS